MMTQRCLMLFPAMMIRFPAARKDAPPPPRQKTEIKTIDTAVEGLK